MLKKAMGVTALGALLFSAPYSMGYAAAQLIVDNTEVSSVSSVYEDSKENAGAVEISGNNGKATLAAVTISNTDTNAAGIDYSKVFYGVNLKTAGATVTLQGGKISTTGRESYGINGVKDSNINIMGSDLLQINTAAGSNGAKGTNNWAHGINTAGNLKTSEESSVKINLAHNGYGVLIKEGGTADLAGTLFINATGSSDPDKWGTGQETTGAAGGLWAYGKGSTINLYGQTEIWVNHKAAIASVNGFGGGTKINNGILASTGGVVNFLGDSETKIETKQEYDHGIVARTGGFLNFTDNSKTTVSTGGDGGVKNPFGMSIMNSNMKVDKNAVLDITTKGNYASGIQLDDATVDLSGSAKVTMNVQALAVAANSIGNSGIRMDKNTNVLIRENADVHITNSGSRNDSHGIDMKTTATNKGNVLQVSNQGKLTIETTNVAYNGVQGSHGISMQGANQTVVFADEAEVNITVKGEDSGGIFNNTSAKAGLTVLGNAKLKINTAGDGGFGIKTLTTGDPASDPTWSNILENAQLEITTNGKNANGVETLNGEFNAAHNAQVTINVEGTESSGLLAGNTARGLGKNNLMNQTNVYVNVKGADSNGAAAINGGITNVVDNAELYVDTTAARNNAVYVADGGQFQAGGLAILDLKNNGTDSNGVLATSDGSFALHDAAVLNYIGKGNDNAALRNTGGNITSDKDALIWAELTGERNYGIFATNGNDGATTLDGGVLINVSGTDSAGIYTGAGAEFGTVTLNGTTHINAADATKGAVYLASDGEASNVVINKNGGATVMINGNLQVAGAAANKIDINFDQSHSALTGAVFGGKDNLGEIKLAFANTAVWNVTNDAAGTSHVDYLELTKGGRLNMQHSGAAQYGQVTIENLSGNNGKILLDTDLQASKDSGNVGENSDKLIITGTSSGEHSISIRDASLKNLQAAEGYLLLVVDKGNKGATFTGENLTDGGLFKYHTIVTDENPEDGSGYTGFDKGDRNWYLQGIAQGTIENPDDIISDNGQANAGLGESRFSMYRHERAERDTLLKRVGELRFDGEEDGLWVRMKGGKTSSDGGVLQSSRFMKYQIGWDKLVTKKATENRHRGFALGYTTGSDELTIVNTALGSSSRTLTVYDTWHGDKGHYLDLVGKIGHIKADFSMAGENAESGESTAWMYNVSAEYGRKKAMGKGWYVEPQVQMGLGLLTGDSYTTSQGNEVDFDSIKTAYVRTGFNLGRNFGTKEQSKVYMKLYWNHDFGANVGWRMGDRNGQHWNSEEDYSGSWWTVGIGTALQMGKNNYFYLDVEKDFSGKVLTDWQVNGGVRWTW